jgi:hypothetical protein
MEHGPVSLQALRAISFDRRRRRAQRPVDASARDAAADGPLAAQHWRRQFSRSSAGSASQRTGLIPLVMARPVGGVRTDRLRSQCGQRAPAQAKTLTVKGVWGGRLRRNRAAAFPCRPIRCWCRYRHTPGSPMNPSDENVAAYLENRAASAAAAGHRRATKGREASDESPVRAAPQALWLIVLVDLLEGLDLLLGLIIGDAARLLRPARQLIAFAGDRVEAVIRELAPFLLDMPFELLPVAFDDVPVDGVSVSLMNTSATLPTVVNSCGPACVPQVGRAVVGGRMRSSRRFCRDFCRAGKGAEPWPRGGSLVATEARRTDRRGLRPVLSWRPHDSGRCAARRYSGVHRRRKDMRFPPAATSTAAVRPVPLKPRSSAAFRAGISQDDSARFGSSVVIECRAARSRGRGRELRR